MAEPPKQERAEVRGEGGFRYSVDQQARDRAVQAQADINAHKDVCTERWKAAADRSQATNEKIDSYHRQVKDRFDAEEIRRIQREEERAVQMLEIKNSIRNLYRHQWIAIGTTLMVFVGLVINFLTGR